MNYEEYLQNIGQIGCINIFAYTKNEVMKSKHNRWEKECNFLVIDVVGRNVVCCRRFCQCYTSTSHVMIKQIKQATVTATE
ncbi:hypothetical protein T11_9635 [Trichinella zimbabwensis]|uniref:Uncharacterized protein n=1 Tax=Trichinella zimbabwensis TaxID=268475 RepID=A0A0V1HH84_9BILA|nr:hypothetical protein T11_9635 [Trichinella zimbabwensis]